jgi:hypothetical protein
LWEKNNANATQVVDFSNIPGHVITLDTHRVVGLAAAAPLPHGVPALITIDLVQVRDFVLDIPL